jgi:hypothetical protein
MRYFDVPRHWTRKIEPHLGDEELNAVLARDFNRYTWGLWRKRFGRGMCPHEFENCDWWHSHRGPMPRFWRYVKHGACHWLVNFNLRLATLASPRRPWTIVTSDRHSTVWDQGGTLFDMNFLALGVPPDKAWELAGGQPESRYLEPGEESECGYCDHYTVGVLEVAARRLGFSADIELRGDRYFLLNSGPRPVCLGASPEGAKAALVRMAEAAQGAG